jgi:transcriptional regulator with XRE-family HTH domain
MKSIHTLGQKQLQRLLRIVRNETGLSQNALARKLAVPQSFVSKYESGERRLDLLEIRRICKALKLNLTEFVARLEKEISDAS